MIGFGIDLAGYTTGGTSLAAIETEGQAARVTLLRGSALSLKRDSADVLSEVLTQEASVMRRCLTLGPVAVDIPVDLQGLPNVDRAEFIWQLTRRPIDRAERGMAPFADRIGAPVARFRAIMQHAKLDDALRRNLFETYPTAIWRKLEINPGVYKSRRKEQAKARTEACTALCKTLGLNRASRTMTTLTQ